MVKNKKQTSLAEKTEQILLTMPRIIATQIGKDLGVQKQQEDKLSLALKKLELQKKKLLDKVTVLKKKNTAASKKQAKTAQKVLQKTQQAITTLVRSLEVIEKQIKALSQKKAMYNALQTQLVSFQKDWVKKMSTQAKQKPKAKVKAKKRAAAGLKKTEMNKSINSMSDHSQDVQMLEIIEAPQQEEAEFAQEEAFENVS